MGSVVEAALGDLGRRRQVRPQDPRLPPKSGKRRGRASVLQHEVLRGTQGAPEFKGGARPPKHATNEPTRSIDRSRMIGATHASTRARERGWLHRPRDGSDTPIIACEQRQGASGWQRKTFNPNYTRKARH